MSSADRDDVIDREGKPSLLTDLVLAIALVSILLAVTGVI